MPTARAARSQRCRSREGQARTSLPCLHAAQVHLSGSRRAALHKREQWASGAAGWNPLSLERRGGALTVLQHAAAVSTCWLLSCCDKGTLTVHTRYTHVRHARPRRMHCELP